MLQQSIRVCVCLCFYFPNRVFHVPGAEDSMVDGYDALEDFSAENRAALIKGYAAATEDMPGPVVIDVLPQSHAIFIYIYIYSPVYS